MITLEELLVRETIFEGDFKTREDVFKEFFEGYLDRDQSVVNRFIPNLDHLHLIYAGYDESEGGYDGYALVFGYDHLEKQFFEVNGSHCSCHGLEGQWEMEYFVNIDHVTKVLELRTTFKSFFDWWCRLMHE